MHGRPRLRPTSTASPRTRRPATLGFAALLVLLLGTSGCSDAVDVTPPEAAGSDACRAAADAWPTTVAHLEKRSTTSDSPAVAAWGDPAVIARCGVAALAPTTDPCIDVDGVGWVESPLSDGSRFTTFGTDPAIEVLVPEDYAPGGLLLPAFTTAARALPANGLECR